MRVGIHTGPLIAGSNAESFDIWGDAVNIVSKIESSGEEGKIHISEKPQWSSDQILLVPRGEINLKNKEIWKTYFLKSIKWFNKFDKLVKLYLDIFFVKLFC